MADRASRGSSRSSSSGRSSASGRFPSSSKLKDGVAVALPPDVSSGFGSVSATDALEFLDQLVATNRISQERASRLRRKYNSLLESIESSRATENALLMHSRDLQQQLVKDHTILEKVEGFPETDSSENTRLRQILLQQENELMQTEEKIGHLEKEMLKLEEEQFDIQKEFDRMPKKEELEEKRRKVSDELELLRNETNARSIDAAKLQESIRLKQVAIKDTHADIDEVKKIASSLQDELAEATIAPLNIPREIDRISKTKLATEEEISTEEKKIVELAKEISQYEEKSVALKEELSSLAADLTNHSRVNESLVVAFDNRDKQLASAKEREGSLLEEAASVELQLRHRTTEHKLLFETYTSRNREKDKELRQLKRGDLSMATIENHLTQLRRRMEAIKLRAMTSEGVAKERESVLEELKADVEQRRKALLEEEGAIEEEKAKLEQCLKTEQRFQLEAKCQRNNVADLSRRVVAITKSRDQDAKSYRKSIRDQELVDDSLRTKTKQVEDQRKYEKELKTQLKEFAQAYELIKTERNKIYAQIQNCHQVIMELREKLKILQNEMEIQRTSAENKSKVLSKAEMALVSKLQDRDSLQQDLGHLRHQQEDQKADIDQQREVIHKLTQQINTFELILNRLRNRYKTAVQDRNDVGLQLIERNEEVCVFHEKINVQDSLIRTGNIELVQKEEEIRYLKMELAKLHSEIDNHHHLLMDKTSLEYELAHCQNELMQCREKLKQLEDEVCDARNPARVRVLAGTDPSCSELRDRITQLESQLTECEQRLLEKELLQEQVNRLADRANRKMESSRNPTTVVANKVSTSQSRLREVTHKMMAVVSELSIQQAKAMQLHQEIQEKEGKLEQAYARLEAGQAPDEETAQQWLQMQRAKRITVQQPIKEEAEEREIGDGVITTAVPRPNAYLPDGEGELPVPKPYGSHAPFKPSAPGANMRHVRKPQPQPLEI